MPKLVNTRTPSVAFNDEHRREALPIPTFRPKQLMPRPTPTLPRALFRSLGQRLTRHLFSDGQRLDIVKPAVVAFQRQRVHRRQRAAEFGIVRDSLAHKRSEQRDDSQGIT